MNKRNELNLRDIGGKCDIPKGLFLRSGKLSILSNRECAELCEDYGIRCVIPAYSSRVGRVPGYPS